MAQCFATCSCDIYEGISKADFDRFTDKIENVLNDDRGRKLFRNFMHTCKLRDGRRTLNFWEHVERLLSYEDDAESHSYSKYLKDIDNLLKEADRIDELDLATMEKLSEARIQEHKEAITEALHLLKVEATKALRREYNVFRRHFIECMSK